MECEDCQSYKKVFQSPCSSTQVTKTVLTGNEKLQTTAVNICFATLPPQTPAGNTRCQWRQEMVHCSRSNKPLKKKCVTCDVKLRITYCEHLRRDIAHILRCDSYCAQISGPTDLNTCLGHTMWTHRVDIVVCSRCEHLLCDVTVTTTHSGHHPHELTNHTFGKLTAGPKVGVDTGTVN